LLPLAAEGNLRITWAELTVSPVGVDLAGLLSDWQWLVGETYQLMVISVLGDLFLRADDGRMFWLDTGWGRLSEVAANAEDFKQLMVSPRNTNEWFAPNLVGDILTAGQRLGPGECFSYKIPLVLGGKYEPENFEPTDLQVHFSVLGQIHRQVKDLPPGTPIGDIKIK
jgi:hypothetical protein